MLSGNQTITTQTCHERNRNRGKKRRCDHKRHQDTTQHFHPPPVSSFRVLLSRYRYPPADPDGTPSRINMLARVAASNTSSTPSILSAEHSLYARAPISLATRSACARETYFSLSGAFAGGRRSALHPTSRIGIVGPHMFRTSSIHCARGVGVRGGWENRARRTLLETFSSESGVSIANAIKMTCDLEYESGRRRCRGGVSSPRSTPPPPGDVPRTLPVHCGEPTSTRTSRRRKEDARSIPQRQLHRLPVQPDLGHVVLKNGYTRVTPRPDRPKDHSLGCCPAASTVSPHRVNPDTTHIFLGKLAQRKRTQERGLATRT